MKQIAKDWRAIKDKSEYKAKAQRAKEAYEKQKDSTKLYHRPHGVKKAPNAFILFMQDKTKQLTEEQLANYHPPAPKHKKRDEKEASKTQTETDQPRQSTVLLNVKTGEEHNEDNEERSQSDYRSTNPTTLTVSSKITEGNPSEKGKFT
jgi:hypothetical protein